MRKISMPRIIVNIFAVIGVISILVIAAAAALFTYVDTGSDIKIISSHPSPNNQNVATIYSRMGGGAAGFCSIKVSINPSTSPFSTSNQDAQLDTDVYIGNCNITPQLNWVSPAVLQVTLPEFIQRNWSSASVKGVSGAVAVQFNFTHNQALKAAP